MSKPSANDDVQTKRCPACMQTLRVEANFYHKVVELADGSRVRRPLSYCKPCHNRKCMERRGEWKGDWRPDNGH